MLRCLYFYNLRRVYHLPALHPIMDGIQITLTLEEFRLFHRIDRVLYLLLATDLRRDPLECLYIMGIWLWLERGGFSNFVSKILNLPPFLINELADEAVACLKCMNAQFPFSSGALEIPLTYSLARKDISLQFFRYHRDVVYDDVLRVVRDVCMPALSDVMERAYSNAFGGSTTQSQMMGPRLTASGLYPNQTRVPSSPGVSRTPSMPRASSSFQEASRAQSMYSSTTAGAARDPGPSRGRARPNEEARRDRTMFVTFSRGYPVSQEEVADFFTRMLGNCIESIFMQEVRRGEQALYARVVFVNSSYIHTILNGMGKVKFTINGKHVWMRKFVPRDDSF